MAIKKFASLYEAIAAGYTIMLGNDEYAEGGEILPRERYHELFKALGASPVAEHGSRDRPPKGGK